jgi:hypothetical protein
MKQRFMDDEKGKCLARFLAYIAFPHQNAGEK